MIDFAADAEAARQRINNWVSEQTEGRIEDLIPPDTINAMTRLVLTNAMYFKAAWLYKFEAEFTNDEPFTLLDGSEVEVPLMITEEPFQYASGEGWQADSGALRRGSHGHGDPAAGPRYLRGI